MFTCQNHQIHFWQYFSFHKSDNKCVLNFWELSRVLIPMQPFDNLSCPHENDKNLRVKFKLQVN